MVFGSPGSTNFLKTGLQTDISLPLLFIDGITRCGKSSLSGIVPSFTGMEHIQFSTMLELIVPGLALRKLHTDYAKSLVRIYLNELSHNLSLGRNVNFRKLDQTGIQNYRDPKVYYSRLEMEDGPEAANAFRSDSKFIPFQTHDFLVNLQSLELLDLNYKMLSLWRDPIDNIYSWWTRGWGERFMNGDPSVFTLLVTNSEGKNLPWYCQGTDYNLSGLNPIECCVVIGTDLIQRAIDAYLGSKKQKKIHLIFFEDLCAEPDLTVDSICKYLGVETTVHTSEMILKARFPREISLLEKEKKIAQFEEGLRPTLFDRVMDFSDRYQTNRYGLA